MSTATYDRPLRAVPAPPEQRERFALLLAIRSRAQQTLNRLLALPRGAAGWVLRHLRALTHAATQHRVLGWVGTRLQTPVRLARAVGVVPLAAAVLSTPPIWRGTQRLASTAGTALSAAGRYLWNRTRQLLARGGMTGQRVEHALTRGGSAVARAVGAVAAHPATPSVTEAGKAALRLVRPISQSVIAHRLLRLIPMQYIRFALELLVLPLVLALGLPEPAGPRSSRTTPVSPVRPLNDEQATRAAAGPTVTVDEEQADERDGALMAGEPLEVPRNRAERRAQQQEQARAKRARALH